MAAALHPTKATVNVFLLLDQKKRKNEHKRVEREARKMAVETEQKM